MTHLEATDKARSDYSLRGQIALRRENPHSLPAVRFGRYLRDVQIKLCEEKKDLGPHGTFQICSMAQRQVLLGFGAPP